MRDIWSRLIRRSASTGSGQNEGSWLLKYRNVTYLRRDTTESDQAVLRWSIMFSHIQCCNFMLYYRRNIKEPTIYYAHYCNIFLYISCYSRICKMKTFQLSVCFFSSFCTVSFRMCLVWVNKLLIFGLLPQFFLHWLWVCTGHNPIVAIKRSTMRFQIKEGSFNATVIVAFW